MAFRRALSLCASIALGAITIGSNQALGSQEASKVDPIPKASKAVDPAAPVLPASIVAAMQEGRYTDASAAIDKESTRVKGADLVYYRLIQGSALRLDKKLDEARKVLSDAIAADREGVWRTKIEFELALVELASRHFDAAEALFHKQANSVWGNERKVDASRLCERLADRVLNPTDRSIEIDAKSALELLNLATELAANDSERIRLTLRSAAVAKDSGDLETATKTLERFLKTFPKAPESRQALYRLAEISYQTQDVRKARRIWTDLVRELDAERAKPELDELRARSLYHIADTYGLALPINLDEAGTQQARRGPQSLPAQPTGVESASQRAGGRPCRGRDCPGRPRGHARNCSTQEVSQRLSSTSFGCAHAFQLGAAYAPLAEELLQTSEPSVDADPGVRRPLLPPKDPKSQRILRILETPISMPFPTETPLGEVLDYVKAATKSEDYNGVPIYVDPVALVEADKTLSSTVTLDIEGVPLRKTLAIALAQLGLTYYVDDGLVQICGAKDPREDDSAAVINQQLDSAVSTAGRRQAIEALQAFLKAQGFRADAAKAKLDFAKLAPIALFQIGYLQASIGKFDDAISTWKTYLVEHPRDAQASLAQGDPRGGGRQGRCALQQQAVRESSRTLSCIYRSKSARFTRL